MTRSLTKTALAGLAAVALLAGGSASTANAQPAAAAPPAPAAAPSLTGPLVPGVCLLSQEEVFGRSKVGQAATARLRSLTQAAQAGVEADRAKLERQGAALNAKRASLSPVEFQAQGQALNKRAQAFQASAAERSRQIDATRNKVLEMILEQAQPYFAQAYAAHGCGLLLSRAAVLGGNLGNDLTPETIAAMDAKATPLTFDLEPASATAP